MLAVSKAEKLFRVNMTTHAFTPGWGGLDLTRFGMKDTRGVEMIGDQVFVSDGYDSRSSSDPMNHAVFVFDVTGPASGPAPTASFNASTTSGTAPLNVQFTDTSTGSPTSWAWTFGDGATSSSQSPSHTYAAGTFTATLVASNANGSTSASRTITVSSAPVAPTASFTASPTSGTAPLNVQFTDTSTGAPTSWAWDFGDGASATTASPAHTYTTAGSYTVSLTATNAAGSNTVIKTGLITVSAPVSGIVTGSSTTAFSGVAVSAVTLAKPAGVAVGDVLVASITTDLNPTMSGVPSGWIPMVNALSINSSATAGARAFAYYHVVGATDPTSYSWTLSAGQKWGAGITAYRGVSTTTPLDTAVVTAVNTSFTAVSLALPSITTVSNGAKLISGVALDSGTPSLTTPPSGWVQEWGAGGGQIAAQADKTQPTAGATGTATWGLSAGR